MNSYLAAHLRYEHGYSWKKLATMRPQGWPEHEWRYAIEVAGEKMGLVRLEDKDD